VTLVLLVEDDDDIRDTLAGVLASHHAMKVIAARNGRDALAKIRDGGARPSVIVLDLMMPEMDGETFLAETAREPLLADVPVVLSTAQARLPEPLPRVVKAVLAKPVRLSDLVVAISSATDEM
jgi:CheY-like chemotaxis protein